MTKENALWEDLRGRFEFLSKNEHNMVGDYDFTSLEKSISEYRKEKNIKSLVSVTDLFYEINKCYYDDSIILSKRVPDSFVDLVVTSPPYADTVSYGSKVETYDSGAYIDWFIPLCLQIWRFLKPTGSFILNINDRIIKKERSPYVFDLITRIVEETPLQLHDRYIWYKKTSLPTGGDNRLNDRIEYIFHFVKDKDQYTAYTDGVRVPYKEVTLRRYKTPINTNDIVDENGITRYNKKTITANPLGTKPTGVLRFDTRSAMQGGKHPAPFHPQLPEWFIKWLTKPGDLVLDPFMGCGTTAHAAKVMERNWIGFEINDTYKQWIDDVKHSYPNNLKPYIDAAKIID
jgi:DNA modification methylase